MALCELHENQLRILGALRLAVLDLGLRDDLLIVGSLAPFLKNGTGEVGDVDVAIRGGLCQRYWDFLRNLALCGIHSVRDVLDPPKWQWNPCRAYLGHPLALTIDCQANSLGFSHPNLDIIP